jgi:hypothetical protein
VVSNVNEKNHWWGPRGDFRNSLVRGRSITGTYRASLLRASADMWERPRVTIFGVAFDQPVIHAGSEVTGKAYLSVNQEQLSCASIRGRIVGLEMAVVTCYVANSDNSRMVRRTEYDRWRFVDESFPICVVPQGVIRRGHYEFPFNFTMPATAPATMYAGDSQNFGFINYTIEVCLYRPGALLWDLCHKRSITVAPTLAVYPTPPIYQAPRSFDVRSLLLFNRGNVLVGWRTESSVVHAGESTSVNFAVLNYSSAPIKFVDVKLTEYATLTALGHHRKNTKRRLFQTRLSPEEIGLSFGGPQVVTNLQTALRQLSEALMSEGATAHTPVCSVRISVPQDAASSHPSGCNIKIRHELKLQLVTAFGTNNLCLTQQICVVNPAPRDIPPAVLRSEVCGEAFQVPPDWAPLVAPMVTIPRLPCRIAGPDGCAENTYASAALSSHTYDGYVHVVKCQQPGFENVPFVSVEISGAPVPPLGSELNGSTQANGHVAALYGGTVCSAPLEHTVAVAAPVVEGKAWPALG